MALEDRTRLNKMLSGQEAPAEAGAIGKQSRIEDEAEVATSGGFGDTELADGGEGEKKPAAPAATPKAGKPSAGKITVATVPAKSDPSTARTTVGVGEKVTLSAQEEGTWRAGEKDIGRGNSVVWTAPPKASAVNVVFEPYLDSANKNTQASVPILVMAPNKVDFKKTGGVPVTAPGTAGVGMTLAVTVGPTNVSFGAAEWLEQAGPAEGVTGYFAEYVKTGQSLAHKPNPAWLPMGANNDEIRDNAWTKDKPKLMHPTEKRMRWWAGSFSWNIPNYFRVAGGSPQLIGYVRQSFTMDDNGAITVTKGGQSATARPDNKLDGDIEKYATVKDALAQLNVHGPGGAIPYVMNYKRNPKADPTSVKNLVAALKQCDLHLYVRIFCNNTFAWTGPDEVTLSANGKPGGKRKINTKKDSDYSFAANSILDFDKMTPGDSIKLDAQVSDFTSTHAHSYSLAYPFSASDVTMQGSDRYVITKAFFRVGGFS